MFQRMITVATWHGDPPETLDREVSIIHSACERAIGLEHPNLEFRSLITDAIRASYLEHRRGLESDSESRQVQWRVPAEAVRPSLHSNTVMLTIPADELLWAAQTVFAKKRKQELASFEALIKTLARAFCRATGCRPKATFSHAYRRGYGPFWKLVEIVLPTASAIAAQTGKPLRRPASASARAQTMKRILNEKDFAYLIKYEQARFRGEVN